MQVLQKLLAEYLSLSWILCMDPVLNVCHMSVKYSYLKSLGKINVIGLGRIISEEDKLLFKKNLEMFLPCSNDVK